MKQIASVIILLTSTVLFAQDSFNSHSVSNTSLSDTTMWPSSTGVRGVWSGSDLDKDGRQEVWVTDYNTGGRVHAFEWY